MPLLKTYQTTLQTQLKKELNLKNIHEVPRLAKVIVNSGIGTYAKQYKDLSQIETGFAQITGQKPIIIKANISVSNFKLRAGQPNGIKVTLRSQRMYDFTERLVNIVLPRIRDFRGLSLKSFDGHGNYNIGITEHTVFPEINPVKINQPFSLEIVIVTTAQTDEAGQALLTSLGFPFKK